jgi:hypothetical protein
MVAYMEKPGPNLFQYGVRHSAAVFRTQLAGWSSPRHEPEILIFDGANFFARLPKRAV